jgi:hypothetical protein
LIMVKVCVGQSSAAAGFAIDTHSAAKPAITNRRIMLAPISHHGVSERSGYRFA